MNNNKNWCWINPKCLIISWVILFTSCGYSDELHLRHHQLGLFWNYRFHDLEISLNKQHDLYKRGKLTGAEFSRQIMSIEWANAGADERFEAFVAEYPNSRWSHLLHGLYLTKQAGDARGSQTYNKTPQLNVDEMTELAEKAKNLLEIAYQHQAPFGLYAGGLLKVNLLLNVNDENKSLVNEAMARDGDIWRAPLTYFRTLYPQWGGSESAMLAFIEEVKPKNAKLTKAMQADFYWRRGRDYQGSNQISAEISEHLKAISFYAHSDALMDLGNIYMREGKCDEAVELFKRNLKENDEWDLYSLESLMQAHDCAGNNWQFSRVKSKRSELFSRYSGGE